ncbi:MAG: hypothetical protein R2744_06715 [Bacteroidales bacterium]
MPVSYEEPEENQPLKTPTMPLLLVSTREYSPDITLVKGKLSIALDNIQDPGNLGTIVRLAGWSWD